MLQLKKEEDLAGPDDLEHLLDAAKNSFGLSDILTFGGACVFGSKDELLFKSDTVVRDYFKSEKKVAFSQVSENPDKYISYICTVLYED